MVEALVAQGPDDPLGDRVRPRRSGRRQQGLDAESTGPRDEVAAVQHLRALLTGFLAYYNRDRPHRALRLETPYPVTRATVGPIRRRAVLGGLHQVYERAA
jgi:transposase InsO family protein